MVFNRSHGRLRGMDTPGNFAAIFQRDITFANRNLVPYYINPFNTEGANSFPSD